MGIVNEYTPACGWIKYHKRKAILGKAKAVSAFLFLIAICAIYGQIEAGM